MKGPLLAFCVAVVIASPLLAQDSQLVTQRAESLKQAGRPWHAAELLLRAASRDSHPKADIVLRGAEAELAARRYERARTLLTGQPWLNGYENGEALAVLAEAEERLGMEGAAALHYAEARLHAQGARAAVLSVRAGAAWERLGAFDSAAAAYAAARTELPGIGQWLRLREARVTPDTARAFALFADLAPPASRQIPVTRARALLTARDTALALDAFAAAGHALDVVRLALANGDTARARRSLYDLLARSPESDDAASGVGIALATLPPQLPAERVAVAHALKLHGGTNDALLEVGRAVQSGDSSGATLLFYGELLASTGRSSDAIRAYEWAARDSSARALALYRRGRLLARSGQPDGLAALASFAEAYPGDSAAPSALYAIADTYAGSGDKKSSRRWFTKLLTLYPVDPRASLARFRLAAEFSQRGFQDSAAALYRAEVSAGGSQRLAARYWLGKLAAARHDRATARTIWLALARDDSLGYYGIRARRAARLAPLRITEPPADSGSAAATLALARLDTLVLAGLDSEARLVVQDIVSHPPTELPALLVWSDGLARRGWGPAAVRLGWQAALLAPNDARVLRAIFPWPNRAAVEAEAQEFNLDPQLLAGIVRQESTFDPEAVSPAGARGLAQLLPRTAAFTAKGLDVAFDTDWITVPDLNLHLGAAHFSELLRRFGGRVDAAVAAYNAGAPAVRRWLGRQGADDADTFIESIPFAETKGYVRAVLRNREVYRALYVKAGE